MSLISLLLYFSHIEALKVIERCKKACLILLKNPEIKTNGTLATPYVDCDIVVHQAMAEVDPVCEGSDGVEREAYKQVEMDLQTKRTKMTVELRIGDFPVRHLNCNFYIVLKNFGLYFCKN